MAFANIYDDTFPADTELANLIGANLRQIRLDVQQRMAVISGLDASKPNFAGDAQPGNWNGILFFATDTGKFYQFNNPTWTDVTSGFVTNFQTTQLVGVNLQAASYQPIISDVNKLILMNVAGANNFTVPTNATVAFAIGTVFGVTQFGAGQTTLVAAGGVTINTPSSLTTRAQYSTVVLVQTSANVWLAGGDLT
jgi:hypothetical protein